MNGGRGVQREAMKWALEEGEEGGVVKATKKRAGEVHRGAGGRGRRYKQGLGFSSTCWVCVKRVCGFGWF